MPTSAARTTAAVPMTPVRTRTAVTFRQPVNDPDPRDVQPAVVEALSTCQRWYYFREDTTGTPWVVLFRPTEQTRSWFGTLDAARAWTAGPAIADLLREAHTAVTTARDTTGRNLDRAAYGHACWTYLLHIEQVGTPDNTPAGPTTRCRCGGWLAPGPAGIRHVDCCPRCWTPQDGWKMPRACVPFRDHHTACLTPTPGGTV